jgi:hypothetical protein
MHCQKNKHRQINLAPHGFPGFFSLLLPFCCPRTIHEISRSVTITLALGRLDKLDHALDDLVCHPRQRHVGQMLAVALSSRRSRVPEHVRLLHELVCQPGRVGGLGVGHAPCGRPHKVVSRLRRIFGDAGRRVGRRGGGRLQRLQRLASWFFDPLPGHLLRGWIFQVGWRDGHSWNIFSVLLRWRSFSVAFK